MMEAYKDLLIEIDVLTSLRADLVRQLEQHHRVVWTGVVVGSRPVHVPLDKALSQYNNVVERLTAIEEELAVKQALREDIEQKLSGLSGLAHTIGYMRYVEGKSLKMIADELGYSYGAIRNKAQKPKR